MHTPRNIQGGYTAADFWTQHSSTTPRVCICVKVTPRVGTALGFTSNTRDMTLPGHSGVTFRSTPAITPTVAESALDEATNMELTGLYTSDSFDQTEVLAGKYNFAAIEVFTVSWHNVNLGELLHFRGNLGEVKDYQTYFTAEARGLISRLSNDVNIVTSRFCRAPEFRGTTGPFACNHSASTVVIGGVTYNIPYTAVPLVSVASQSELEFDTTVLNDADLDTNRVLVNGKIECTSGDNDGISREIASVLAIFPGYRIQLKRPFPLTLTAGDEFTITAGCNHTIEDCIKFGNIVNRRAEDWIPGIEAANRVNDAN